MGGWKTWAWSWAGLFVVVERDTCKWLFKCWQNPQTCLCVLSQDLYLLLQPLSPWFLTAPPQSRDSSPPHIPPSPIPAIPTLSGSLVHAPASHSRPITCWHHAGDRGQTLHRLHILSHKQLWCCVCIRLFVQLVQLFLFLFLFGWVFFKLLIYRNNRDFRLKRPSENNLMFSERGARRGNMFLEIP